MVFQSPQTPPHSSKSNNLLASKGVAYSLKSRSRLQTQLQITNLLLCYWTDYSSKNNKIRMSITFCQQRGRCRDSSKSELRLKHFWNSCVRFSTRLQGHISLGCSIASSSFGTIRLSRLVITRSNVVRLAVGLQFSVCRVRGQNGK